MDIINQSLTLKTQNKAGSTATHKQKTHKYTQIFLQQHHLYTAAWITARCLYSRPSSAGRDGTQSSKSTDSYPFVFPRFLQLISIPVMLPCTQQLTSPSASLLGKKEGCCHHFVLKSYFPVDPAVLICTAALQQDTSTIKVNSACISPKYSTNIFLRIFLEVKAKFCRKN